MLRKWNSSEPSTIQHLNVDLIDSCLTHTISDVNSYTKTLGLAWNTTFDHFRINTDTTPKPEVLTKWTLVSRIARTFDILGWFAPSTIKMKILLQRVWELKLGWDEAVPPFIEAQWSQWNDELPSLSNMHLPRCYYPKDTQIVSLQLHGFCDASEDADAGVLYLRMESITGLIHTCLVTSKTKVSPIKRLTIPRLELRGTHLLTQLLCHVKGVLDIPASSMFAWTDSTVVLSWLNSNHKQFKTYVGNRVSFIVDQLHPNHWRHVSGMDNPADCASRGLFPSELISHSLWWEGPPWLTKPPTHWPIQAKLKQIDTPDEERQSVLLLTCSSESLFSSRDVL